MAVITMGGLAGGGARSLGPIVAQRLGADYVDRLILSDGALRFMMVELRNISLRQAPTP